MALQLWKSLGLLDNILPFRAVLYCSAHFTSFIFSRPFLTSSSHRDLGLPAGLPVNGFHLCIRDFGHVRKSRRLRADFRNQSDLRTVSHASKNSPSCESSSMLTTNSCKHLQYHILVSHSGGKSSYTSLRFCLQSFVAARAEALMLHL